MVSGALFRKQQERLRQHHAAEGFRTSFFFELWRGTFVDSGILNCRLLEIVE